MFEKCSFALASRTSLPLAIALVHVNNDYDTTRYHRFLREHAEASGGLESVRQRTNRYQGRDTLTGKRRASLR